MPRSYSPITFLRQAPNRLLGFYFKRRHIDLGLDWDSLSETAVNRILPKLEQLPAATYKEIESDFSMVNELSCSAGAEAILEVGKIAGHDDWAGIFRGARNTYQIALWTFLEHPQVFHRAADLRQMDRFRAWTRWYVGAGFEPAHDKEALSRLSQSLSTIYAKQGRGRFCHLDTCVRRDPERHCFLAFPEDHTRTDMGYTENGRFVQHRPRRTALEVIFVYRPGEGTLELHARGRRDFKTELAEVFCRAILGLDGLPGQKGKARYDLSVFKDRKFRFVTDPADSVEAVQIRRLDLTLSQAPDRQVILVAKPSRRRPRPVYELLADVTTQSGLALDKLAVTNAKVRLIFAQDERGRARTLTFEVGHPDRCTLRDDKHDQIARGCLRRWGVDCA